jgi:hypothetical protein
VEILKQATAVFLIPLRGQVFERLDFSLKQNAHRGSFLAYLQEENFVFFIIFVADGFYSISISVKFN